MNVLGFHYPDDAHVLLERDMWARVLGDGRVQVGVTAFGVKISGHFFMCRPKPVGTTVEQGATIAVAELNKSVVTVKSPVTGVVDEINEALAHAPELVEQDPYGRGWIAVLKPTRWDADLKHLAHGSALPALAERRMRMENLDFSEGAA